jgi:hypothetical protein
MHPKIRDFAAQAGFVGDNMYPVFGTCQETALQNLVQMVVEDCARVLDEDSVWNPELGGYAHDLRVRYGIDPVKTLEK